MNHYRCYFARHPAFVTTGSRVVVEQYQRTGDWSLEARVWFTDYPAPNAPPQLFTVAQLPETHVLMRELEAESLEAAFGAMQTSAGKLSQHWRGRNISAKDEALWRYV